MYGKLYYIFYRLSKYSIGKKSTAWSLLSLVEAFLFTIISQITIKTLEANTDFVFDEYIDGKEELYRWLIMSPLLIILTLNVIYFWNRAGEIIKKIESDKKLSTGLANLQIPVFVISISLFVVMFAIGNVR